MKIKIKKSVSGGELVAQLQTANGPEVDIAPAAVLIATCFEARNMAHKLHLQSSSYAQHVALDTFYNEIISLVDAYAESYQGRYGKIMSYPSTTVLECNDPVKLITDLREFIDNIRVNCGVQSELQNAIDSIQELSNTTLYKLINLA